MNNLSSVLLVIIFTLFTANAMAQEKKVEIVDLYYSDKKGKEKEDLIIGTKYAYLTILTKYAKGKKVTLDLSDELAMGLTIYYKGDLVTEPVLVKIKKNKQIIKLQLDYSNYQLEDGVESVGDAVSE